MSDLIDSDMKTAEVAQLLGIDVQQVRSLQAGAEGVANLGNGW